MARAAEAHLQGGEVEESEESGDVVALHQAAAQVAVHLLEDLHGARARGEVREQAHADQGRLEGRGEPVPGHVGEEQAQGALVEEAGVVEVAAHRAAGAVADLELQSFHAGKILGKEGLLDLARHLHLRTQGAGGATQLLVALHQGPAGLGEVGDVPDPEDCLRVGEPRQGEDVHLQHRPVGGGDFRLVARGARVQAFLEDALGGGQEGGEIGDDPTQEVGEGPAAQAREGAVGAQDAQVGVHHGHGLHVVEDPFQVLLGAADERAGAQGPPQGGRQRDGGHAHDEHMEQRHAQGAPSFGKSSRRRWASSPLSW